ncbi:hypothetical protein DFP74_4341 [Nocardiopsis sp. Huas11]|uniref:hypothetical protein n=1 Tax=Nocardiopsis sp. Huas11 TaxID=2183912 RepID=UPI000EB04A47|nr:hypothetical protein [Nocardiopsis sp. Huas11]RKS08627.1 hypothetical protein DFP74_4341 [Nocardiopsis sp. Huas11]
MRSVFVFPSRGRAETAEALDRHLTGGQGSWVVVRPDDHVDLYVDIDDAGSGLFCDWEPDAVAALEARLGHCPAWAVRIDLSRRIDGVEEVGRLLALLLDSAGVAVDDHSDHLWSLREIESGAVVDGLRFLRGPGG